MADKLAMWPVDMVLSRELTYAAARAKDAGKRCDIEAGMAKLLAARAAWSNADAALQVHGGNGYALEYEISRVLCDARILNIFEGAAEIQAQVVARGLIERAQLMGRFDAWIGREERRHDRVDAGLVARWCATLDRRACVATTVPQGLHWCLGLPEAPTARLGPDGHALRDENPNSFLPPVLLPRRMWASSRIEFLRPLRNGEAVERVSRILAVTEKQGGSGALVFVEVAHETSGDGTLAVREVQSLVYREPAPAGSPPAPPSPASAAFDPAGWDAHRAITEPSHCCSAIRR